MDRASVLGLCFKQDSGDSSPLHYLPISIQEFLRGWIMMRGIACSPIELTHCRTTNCLPFTSRREDVKVSQWGTAFQNSRDKIKDLLKQVVG